MSTFTMTSNSITEGQHHEKRFSFNSFGNDGDNISPQLAWENAPQGTKSFAVTCFDPDAPTDCGFWHWQVINIPASTHELTEGASANLAAGLEMRNDYGFNGYGGACPPEGHGVHRYVFTVWALPCDKMEVPDDASCALVSFMLNGTALAKSTITAHYQR